MSETYELESKWTLYAHAIDNDYQSNIIQLSTVSTIQSFWGMYNNIPKISQMFDSCIVRIHGRTINGFSLFKENIKPEWEDSKNIEGSEWYWRDSISYTDLDNIWLNLLLASIGEHFEHVNGVRIVNKPQTLKHSNQQKLEIWMSNEARFEEELNKINECIKPYVLSFTHTWHTCAKKNSSKKKKIYPISNINSDIAKYNPENWQGVSDLDQLGSS